MKIKIKNISGTNQRLLFRPNSPNANVNIIDPTYNPTLGVEESGSFYFCLAPIEEPEFAGETDFAFYSSSNNYLGRFRTLEFQLMGVPLEVDGPIPCRSDLW